MSYEGLSIDLLSDDSLQLLVSNVSGLDAHTSRQGLLKQLVQHMKEEELCPTFTHSTFKQLPEALFGFSVVQYGEGDLYVFGGRASSDTNLSIDSHFYSFSQKTHTWHAVKQYNPIQPRRWHSAAIHDDAMYIYGGQCWDDTTAEWEACSTIDRFDFKTSRWSTVDQHGCSPSTKVKRCATAVGASMYVLPAGQHSNPTYTMLHSFELDTGCWNMQSCSGDTCATDIPDGQHLVMEQLLHYNNTLLAVFSMNPAAADGSHHHHHQQQQHQEPASLYSGKSALAVYSLSLSTRKWSKLSTAGKAPTSRTQSCITLVDELLAVSGGTRGAEMPLLADLAFLHIPSRRWYHLQLPAVCQPARACHAAAVIEGGRVLLMGGWHEAWPTPAPGMILQRKYVRKEPSAEAGEAKARGDNSSACSRLVINSELRSILQGTACSGDVSSSDAAVGRICTGSSISRSMPFSDVTLTSSEGQQFRAHRFIIASQSPVLKAMLSSSDMSEALSGVINLPDISSAVLEALLSYLYGGLPAGIPQELVLELFTAADRFMLPGLAAECVLVLLGCLTSENVSLVADLANTHRLPDLWEACVRFSSASDTQLEVFNSAAYAQLWQDSSCVAQAFTAQVIGVTQQLMSRMKQQMPSTAVGAGNLGQQPVLAVQYLCTLPALQTDAGLSAPSKRQRLQ